MSFLQAVNPLAIVQAMNPLNTLKPLTQLITPASPFLRLNQMMASQKMYVLFDKVYQLLRLPQEPRSLAGQIAACGFFSAALATSVTLSGEIFLSTVPAIAQVLAPFFKIWGISSSLPVLLSIISIGGVTLSALCIVSGIVGLALLTKEYQKQLEQEGGIQNYFEFINKNRDSEVLSCFKYTLIIQKAVLYTVIGMSIPHFLITVLPAITQQKILRIACCLFPVLMMTLLFCSRDHRQHKDNGIDEGLQKDHSTNFRKLFVLMDVGNILQNIYFPSSLGLGIIVIHTLCIIDDVAQGLLNPENEKQKRLIKNLAWKFW